MNKGDLLILYCPEIVGIEDTKEGSREGHQSRRTWSCIGGVGIRLANGDDELLATESSDTGLTTLTSVRQYHLAPGKILTLSESETADIREEWVSFGSDSGALLHNCRTNVTWLPQCPDHKEVR